MPTTRYIDKRISELSEQIRIADQINDSSSQEKKESLQRQLEQYILEKARVQRFNNQNWYKIDKTIKNSESLYTLSQKIYEEIISKEIAYVISDLLEFDIDKFGLEDLYINTQAIEMIYQKLDKYHIRLTDEDQERLTDATKRRADMLLESVENGSPFWILDLNNDLIYWSNYRKRILNAAKGRDRKERKLAAQLVRLKGAKRQFFYDYEQDYISAVEEEVKGLSGRSFIERLLMLEENLENSDTILPFQFDVEVDEDKVELLIQLFEEMGKCYIDKYVMDNEVWKEKVLQIYPVLKNQEFDSFFLGINENIYRTIQPLNGKNLEKLTEEQKERILEIAKNGLTGVPIQNVWSEKQLLKMLLYTKGYSFSKGWKRFYLDDNDELRQFISDAIPDNLIEQYAVENNDKIKGIFDSLFPKREFDLTSEDKKRLKDMLLTIYDNLSEIKSNENGINMEFGEDSIFQKIPYLREIKDDEVRSRLEELDADNDEAKIIALLGFYINKLTKVDEARLFQVGLGEFRYNIIFEKMIQFGENVNASIPEDEEKVDYTASNTEFCAYITQRAEAEQKGLLLVNTMKYLYGKDQALYPKAKEDRVPYERLSNYSYVKECLEKDGIEIPEFNSLFNFYKDEKLDVFEIPDDMDDRLKEFLKSFNDQIQYLKENGCAIDEIKKVFYYSIQITERVSSLYKFKDRIGQYLIDIAESRPREVYVEKKAGNSAQDNMTTDLMYVFVDGLSSPMAFHCELKRFENVSKVPIAGDDSREFMENNSQHIVFPLHRLEIEMSKKNYSKISQYENDYKAIDFEKIIPKKGDAKKRIFKLNQIDNFDKFSKKEFIDEINNFIKMICPDSKNNTGNAIIIRQTEDGRPKLEKNMDVYNKIAERINDLNVLSLPMYADVLELGKILMDRCDYTQRNFKKTEDGQRFDQILKGLAIQKAKETNNGKKTSGLLSKGENFIFVFSTGLEKFKNQVLKIKTQASTKAPTNIEFENAVGDDVLINAIANPSIGQEIKELPISKDEVK